MAHFLKKKLGSDSFRLCCGLGQQLLVLNQKLRNQLGRQCDQMLERKAAKWFTKVDQKVALASFYIKSDLFDNCPNTHKMFGLFL